MANEYDGPYGDLQIKAGGEDIHAEVWSADLPKTRKLFSSLPKYEELGVIAGVLGTSSEVSLPPKG